MFWAARYILSSWKDATSYKIIAFLHIIHRLVELVPSP
jgi:hypothetical protein